MPKLKLPVPDSLRPAPKRPSEANGGPNGALGTAKEAGISAIDWVDERTSVTGVGRWAMFRNMLVALFQHERIRTTEAKAKAVRGLAEHMITLAKRENRESPIIRSTSVSSCFGKSPLAANCKVLRSGGPFHRKYESLEASS